MYSFLSEQDNKGPSGSYIADDIRGNASYFKKVRFSITGDRYPHPQAKPFLDDAGRPTYDGNFSHRPNPAWFHQRVDLAVRTACEFDVIADLILCGPDTQDSRSTLKWAEPRRSDPSVTVHRRPVRQLPERVDLPVQRVRHQAAELLRGASPAAAGSCGGLLPYPVPVSVHASAQDSQTATDTTPPWNDHVIIQRKIKTLSVAADWLARKAYRLGGGIPAIDDELAYEGQGDGWSEEDVIEAHVGAFLGGGYGTTGHKPGNKQGHYFWGNFQAAEHRAADNLGWLRHRIDENIRFWRMAPASDPDPRRHDRDLPPRAAAARVLERPGHEYVLGTNQVRESMRADLPTGTWQVARYDAVSQRAEDPEFRGFRRIHVRGPEFPRSCSTSNAWADDRNSRKYRP